MNLAHLHLLINHLPIFGTILGLLVFVHGLWSKSKSTQMAAYNLFIVSAIGAAIAYFTGEPAEDLVENIPGILETTIEAHEEAAEIALFCIGALGLLSVAAALNTWMAESSSKFLRVLVFVCALVSFATMARTGFLGGQIRHTELQSTSAAPVTQPANNEEKE